MNGTYRIRGWVLASSFSSVLHWWLMFLPLVSRAHRNHGYDPADPSMHGIFVAHGPFASSVKRSLVARGKAPTVPIAADPHTDPHTLVVGGFKNTEVYGLVARLLGVPRESRAPTNGTGGFWDAYLGPE